jgi:hypothetical protein
LHFVSATRLKLRSIFHLPAFIVANNESVQQLLVTDGFISGKELPDKGLVFWTLTLWRSDADMKAFRNSTAHRKAMQKLPVWCNEATYIHWLQEEPTLPDWNTVYERMMTDGVVSKVKNPSVRHLSKSFGPIKWTKLERILKQ